MKDSKKRGRKSKIKDSVRVTAYLSKESSDKLTRIGDDNFSCGVRVALKAYLEQYGDEIVPELLMTVK